MWKYKLRNKMRYFESPRVFVHYVKKYLTFKSSLVEYKVYKLFKYDARKKRLARVLKKSGVCAPEELYKVYLSNRKNIFLADDVDMAIEDIKNDKAFLSAIIQEADAVLKNVFRVLGVLRSDMYDKNLGCYKWHTDFNTGYQYVRSHYSTTRRANNVDGVDIKNIWEMARMQYLFAPALAYRLTGKERYAEKVVDIVVDFIRMNPVGEGPNWNVSMEVGIRLANILLALELIQSAECVDGHVLHEIICSTQEHLLHILKNEEKIVDKSSNHYLGGLLGLLAGSAFFPFLEKSDEIIDYASRSLIREINHQILGDGGHFEGSTSYQRLVGELLLFSAIICKRININLDEATKQRLLAMLEFTFDILKPNDRVPQIGDNDSGRVFRLLKEDSTDHRSFLNLGVWFCTGKRLYPNLKDGFTCFMGPSSTGTVTSNVFRKKTFAVKPDFRIITFHQNQTYLIFSAIDAHRFDLAGHTHNDLLSFELNVSQQDFIVDPGTGEYTGNPNIRNLFRSTKIHATIMVDGLEQRRFFSSGLFYLHNDATTSIKMKRETDRVIFTGAHTGYVDRVGVVHERVIECDNDGTHIKVIDRILGNYDQLRCCLPLAPGVQVKLDEISRKVILARDEAVVEVSGTWDFRLIEGSYSPAYGFIAPAKHLVAYCDDAHLEQHEILLRIFPSKPM